MSIDSKAKKKLLYKKLKIQLYQAKLSAKNQVKIFLSLLKI